MDFQLLFSQLYRSLCPARKPALWLLFVLCLQLPLQAQTDAPAEPEKPKLTMELIDARLKAVQDASGLDEAIKTKVADLYTQAKKSLEAAAVWDENQRKNQQLLKTVSERLQAEKDKLETAKNPPEVIAELRESLDSKMPNDLEKLEKLLSEFETELKAWQTELDDPQNGLRKKLSDVKNEASRRSTRIAEIAALNTQQRLQKVREQLELPVNADDPPEVAAAQKTLLEARARELENQAAAERSELALYEAENQAGLLRTQQDALTLQISVFEKQVTELQKDVSDLRSRQAKIRSQNARAQAIKAAPELEQIAKENATYANTNVELTEEMRKEEKRLNVVKNTSSVLTKQYEDYKLLIESIGQTDRIGMELRKQRTLIPDASHYRARIEKRQEEMNRLRFQKFQMTQERDRLVDINQAVEQTFEELDPKPAPEQKGTTIEALRELLESRKTLLDALIKSSEDLEKIQGQINNEEIKLMATTAEFTKFIDERVFWIRSDPALWAAGEDGGKSVLADTADALRWLTTPGEWGQMLGSFFSWNWQDVAEIVLTSILFFILAYYRSRLRAGIVSTGEEASRRNCQKFQPTVQAFLLTLVVAAIWPALLLYCSWRIAAQPDATPFALAISQGLAVTAAIYLPLEVIRQCCASKGLAEMHFSWSNAAVRLIRTHLRWATPLSLPLIFLAATMHAQSNEDWHDSLGRLCVISLLIVLEIVLQRILRPQVGVINEMLMHKTSGWAGQLKYLAYGLGLLVPAGMALLAALGYYYTVVQLGTRLKFSVWLFITLLILYSLLDRLLLVHRRRLAMEHARAKRLREIEENAASEQSATSEVALTEVPLTEELEPDLKASTSQTQKLALTSILILFFAGMWMIWSDVTPALGVLNKFELWSTMETVTVEKVDPQTSKITPETNEQPRSVTVVDLGLALLIGILAAVAAQNIPGLIEMSLLRGLPFEPGFRYAISSLARYAIMIIGLAAALGVVGIGWSKMQWLFAAASLGLGFGLQEIFANFVSGIIILFERPIRVGDIVTIGDVSGIVSKIRIRATTITDWDRKELIVPNKEFITGRLLNWTLTDPINRVVLNVGVAYGSDTKLTRELLLQTAAKNDIILKDPAPVATFEGFGSSTLDFVLRVYLPNLDNRLNVIHALHMEIDRSFREHKIEIAFPQQDIHVKTLPANHDSIPTEDMESIFRPGKRVAVD